MSALDDDYFCAEHGDALIWEPGGVDMPTIKGRFYCPTCQRLFMTAIDVLNGLAGEYQ